MLGLKYQKRCQVPLFGIDNRDAAGGDTPGLASPPGLP